jgi:hypothetical protein
MMAMTNTMTALPTDKRIPEPLPLVVRPRKGLLGLLLALQVSSMVLVALPMSLIIARASWELKRWPAR